MALPDNLQRYRCHRNKLFFQKRCPSCFIDWESNSDYEVPVKLYEAAADFEYALRILDEIHRKKLYWSELILNFENLYPASETHFEFKYE